MSDDDLKQIEALIRKHKPEMRESPMWLAVLFILFLTGAFKGCGY